MSQLIPCENLSSASCYPPTPTFKLRKKCDNPDVFDAFLHYVYGSHIRLLPPPNAHSNLLSPQSDHSTTSGTGTNLLDGIESTPDTSFTSLDENDLTEEYDKYYVNNHNELDEDLIKVCELPIVLCVII